MNTDNKKSNGKKIGLIVGVLFVALLAVVVWWFLRDNAPEAVDLDSAIDNVATDSDIDAEASLEGGIAGSWVVDTQTGEFDYESATGSFAGFRVEEELANVGSVTAVGRTGDVEGSMTIDGTTLSEASFVVDMSTITTNDGRRDNATRNALETSEFPTAEFKLTEPIELGDGADSGESVDVTARGELTIHGVTNEVEMNLQAKLTGATIVVVGSTDVTFSDYGVDTPTARIVVSLDDFGVIEFQMLLVKE